MRGEPTWRSSHALAWLALITLLLGGCQRETHRCGVGTVERGGQCIAGSLLQTTCGPGTVRAGATCVALLQHTCGPGEAQDAGGRCHPLLACGEGTVARQGRCVPGSTCGAGTPTAEGGCACPQGHRYAPDLNTCVALLCGPGELLTHGGNGCTERASLCGPDTALDPETGLCAPRCPQPEGLHIEAIEYDDRAVLGNLAAHSKRIFWSGEAEFPVKVRYILNGPCPPGTTCELSPHVAYTHDDPITVEGYSCRGIVPNHTQFPFAIYLEDAAGRTSQVVPAPFTCVHPTSTR